MLAQVPKTNMPRVLASFTITHKYFYICSTTSLDHSLTFQGLFGCTRFTLHVQQAYSLTPIVNHSPISLTMVDTSSFRWGFATASLSMQSQHTLKVKFQALKDAGFKYTELGMGGFIEWVRQQNPNL